MNPITKPCLRCREVKPVSAFSKHKGRSDGLQAYCKACYNDANRVSHAKNQARLAVEIPASKVCGHCGILKLSAEFFRDDRRADGLYSSCKQCHTDRTDAWKQKNHRDSLLIQARSRAKRVDANRDYARRRYWENPELHSQRKRAWKKRNPRKNAEAARRYYARRRYATVGTVDYEEIWKRDGGKCHICGRAVERNDVDFDHIVPLARGGLHSVENVAVSHASCNRRKGTKLMSELIHR